MNWFEKNKVEASVRNPWSIIDFIEREDPSDRKKITYATVDENKLMDLVKSHTDNQMEMGVGIFSGSNNLILQIKVPESREAELWEQYEPSIKAGTVEWHEVLGLQFDQHVYELENSIRSMPIVEKVESEFKRHKPVAGFSREKCLWYIDIYFSCNVGILNASMISI
jgi:hypothetical protein